MLHALVREVPRSIAFCELTHLPRQPIDLDRARAEHHAYTRTLAGLGAQIVELPEEPELPDSVFVEDTAIVLGRVAILLRPGAPSRRPEVASVARALARYLEVRALDGDDAEGGTVDGGDVLRVGSTLFVGRSTRSDEAGVAALARAVAPLGFEVREVSVGGCLHLKSAVTSLGGGALLANPAWVDLAVLAHTPREIVEVDPTEPHAANALHVADTLIYPAATYPATAERLRERGFHLTPVELGELAKAEGAVTCCSIPFET